MDVLLGLFEENPAELHHARTFRCGPIRIDEGTREVHVGKTPVVLRRAEFNVLLYLVARAPYPATQESIMRDVLRASGNGSSARFHVCEIRKKLRAAGVDDAIVTLAAQRAYRMRWRARTRIRRVPAP